VQDVRTLFNGDDVKVVVSIVFLFVFLLSLTIVVQLKGIFVEVQIKIGIAISILCLQVVAIGGLVVGRLWRALEGDFPQLVGASLAILEWIGTQLRAIRVFLRERRGTLRGEVTKSGSGDDHNLEIAIELHAGAACVSYLHRNVKNKKCGSVTKKNA
jgi:hypothetical protein